MKLSEFDYYLDPQRIAQEPADTRTHSRLLVLDKNREKWYHQAHFEQIIDYFVPGDVLVLNNTKVINARLIGKKSTGGKVEALIISFEQSSTVAMLQTGRRPKPGDIYSFGSYRAKVCEKVEDGWKLIFDGVSVEQVMDEIGHPPLPPYIKRKGKLRERMDEQDRNRYQTVYAQTPGSIAAPTAGLHFTKELLARLEKKGIEIQYLTLHVGLGTFLPVKAEMIQDHKMHTEYYQISSTVADRINLALQENRRVIATGTTSCRVLETVGKEGTVVPGQGHTNIFIYPGFQYKIISGLITNFHLPKSTLLMLVSAFAGREIILKVYQDAIDNSYHFFSYGDAMFIY